MEADVSSVDDEREVGRERVEYQVDQHNIDSPWLPQWPCAETPGA